MKGACGGTHSFDQTAIAGARHGDRIVINDGLVARVIDDQSPDLDCLLLMYLLHTHMIRLKKGAVLDDARHGDLLGSLTKAHVAGLIGSRTSATIGRHAEFWLRQFALRTPFEFHDDLPESFRERFEAIRQKALDHPLILEFVAGEG